MTALIAFAWIALCLAGMVAVLNHRTDGEDHSDEHDASP